MISVWEFYSSAGDPEDIDGRNPTRRERHLFVRIHGRSRPDVSVLLLRSSKDGTGHVARLNEYLAVWPTLGHESCSIETKARRWMLSSGPMLRTDDAQPCGHSSDEWRSTWRERTASSITSLSCRTQSPQNPRLRTPPRPRSPRIRSETRPCTRCCHRHLHL